MSDLHKHNGTEVHLPMSGSGGSGGGIVFVPLLNENFLLPTSEEKQPPSNGQESADARDLQTLPDLINQLTTNICVFNR